MTKYILRLDDVGRLNADPPERGSDRKLKHFRQWFEDCGMAGLPVACGVVPAWIDSTGLSVVRELSTRGAIIAMHGWDHAKDVVVTTEQMKTGCKLLSTNVYIPPFNEYGARTMSGWRTACGGHSIFLGGFNLEHHFCGEAPYVWEQLTHYSAVPRLYGMAHDIINNLPMQSDHPLVITLHVPWEPDPVSVKRLVDKIKNDLVSP